MNQVTETRTNEAWVAGVRAQDGAVLMSLRSYLCRSLRVALSGRAGQGDVEDFAQLALERVLERVDSFRGDSRFTTWASAIAIRIAFGELRRKAWGNESLEVLLAEGRVPEAVTKDTGRDAAARGELLTALKAGIATELSERQFAIVTAELRGMPTAVISKEMGMSTGAIYKMHHDARKKLRRYLEQRGFSVADLETLSVGVGERR